MSPDPAGSPRPFEFDDEASPQAQRPAANPFVDTPLDRRSRGRFSWIALAIAVGLAVLLGVAGYARATAAADGFDVDRGVRWAALSVLGAVGALAAVVVSVVAVVRARAARATTPLIVAVIALLCALVLPWLALWLGAALAPPPPAAS